MKKIVYRTNGIHITGWTHELVDTAKYELKENEIFGEEFKKPILSDGLIIESWVESEEIDNLKLSKIERLKENANQKFRKNQWYYDREVKLTKGKRTIKKVPQEIIDEDIAVYDLVDLKEVEINAITDYEELLNYDVTL